MGPGYRRIPPQGCEEGWEFPRPDWPKVRASVQTQPPPPRAARYWSKFL